MGLDRTYLLVDLFLVLHSYFLFVPCGGLIWLPVSFLLHYRIVTLIKYLRVVNYVNELCCLTYLLTLLNVV